MTNDEFSEQLGITRVVIERLEQLVKHGRTVKQDAEFNNRGQLCLAATFLISPSGYGEIVPKGWNEEIWQKMIAKPYKDRLAIAGALICAEIDRLNYIEGDNDVKVHYNEYQRELED